MLSACHRWQQSRSDRRLRRASEAQLPNTTTLHSLFHHSGLPRSQADGTVPFLSPSSLLPTSGDTATPEAFWHTRQHRGARRALRGLGRLGPLRRLRPLGGLRRLKQRISGEIRDPWQCIFWHFEVGTCRKRDQDPQGVVQSPL